MRKMILCYLILVFAVVAILPVQASRLSDAEDLKSSIDSKLADKVAERKEAENKLKQQQELEEQITAVRDSKSNEYKDLISQVSFISKHIDELNATIKQAEASYTAQKELLKKRLRVMYENSNISYFQTLMESKSIIDFLEKIQLISQITKSDNELLKTIDTQKKDIELKKINSMKLKQQRSNAARSTKSDVETWRNKSSDIADKITDTNDKLETIKQEEEDYERASNDVASLMQSLMSDDGYAGGDMTWPVPGYHEINSPFGMRYHPIYHYMRMHNGIDVPAPSGTSVIAAKGGVVLRAEYESSLGNHVYIDHGGDIATLYCHLSSILVNPGDRVKEGEIIGRVGSTGASTGSHLHFGVIKNSSFVNPQNYF
ncbi:MAG: peptidoglycan DD-metalloendopeptidase family protein [Clostridia bacterium]